MKCDCTCHRNCHTCGRPFNGPNDYHMNCGDTVGASGSNGFTTPNRLEPWPDTPSKVELVSQALNDLGSINCMACLKAPNARHTCGREA